MRPNNRLYRELLTKDIDLYDKTHDAISAITNYYLISSTAFISACALTINALFKYNNFKIETCSQEEIILKLNATVIILSTLNLMFTIAIKILTDMSKSYAFMRRKIEISINELGTRLNIPDKDKIGLHNPCTKTAPPGFSFFNFLPDANQSHYLAAISLFIVSTATTTSLYIITNSYSYLHNYTVLIFYFTLFTSICLMFALYSSTYIKFHVFFEKNCHTKNSYEKIEERFSYLISILIVSDIIFTILWTSFLNMYFFILLTLTSAAIVAIEFSGLSNKPHAS